MPDAAFSLLIQALSVTAKTLIVVDENVNPDELVRLKPFQDLLVVTNRFDINQRAIAAGLNCEFNDFTFASYQENSFAQIGFRVPKEKPIAHHIINAASKLLTPHGVFVMSGAKNEGIKSYAKNAAQFFNTTSQTNKSGSNYLATLEPSQTLGQPLDDKQYPNLRPITLTGDTTLLTKPGVFGWNKVDKGSHFLAEQLGSFFNSYSAIPTSILDLGCGYGYLSFAAHRHVDATITATDNNAAAVVCCRENFAQQGIQGEVLASDCGNEITKRFDAVICHPPFHRGFNTEQLLTEKFIASAHTHLKPGGKALFVANQFIPLETQAVKYFSSVERIAEDRSFKVVMFSD